MLRQWRAAKRYSYARWLAAPAELIDASTQQICPRMIGSPPDDSWIMEQRKHHAPAINEDQAFVLILDGATNMTKTFATAAMLLLLAPSAALAQNRTGDAALGAVSGAVVLGPIGAVAGAVIGYSAGPSIARSWGLNGSRSSRYRRQGSKDNTRAATSEYAGASGSRPADRVEKDARVATSRSEENNPAPTANPPAPSAKTPPPVQTFE
jgi:hypothetical protein